MNWHAKADDFPGTAKPFLLDSICPLPEHDVTAPTSSPLIDLRDLRLDDARALIEHDPSATLSAAEESPLAYLQSVIDNLCELSQKDPLTGLSNRRHFRNVLNREIDSVARTGESALFLLLDIDHFKKVNDTHGHLAGDQVLQAVAKCLATCVRPMDTVARYGGEEFGVILPNCHGTIGRIVAERIRAAVESLSIAITPIQQIKVTISVGGAYAPEWVRSTADLWADRADVQLYKAKTHGRNQVFIEPQPEISVSAEEKSMLFGHSGVGEPAWAGNLSGGTGVAQ